MARVLAKFKSAGHDCEAIVIGDEDHQEAYCNELGLEHLRIKNSPLNLKFKLAWEKAIEKKKDYICWLGSNNVHSDEYWEKCLEKISGPAVPSFGTKNFTIVDLDRSNQRTFKWTRRRYHLCSCGQFFFTATIRKTINFNEVFKADKHKDFDGSINRALKDRWGQECIHALESNGLDCIDLKSGKDMHSYDHYNKFPYPQEYTRDEIFERFEELKMLVNGHFK